MLALTDSALAHLAIAATGVDPRQRREWLRDIAAKLDPPINVNGREHGERTPAARRQARVRQRRKNGIRIHRLPLRDLAVEGLITQMVTTGRLTEAEALDDQRIDAELARLLEEQGEQWMR
jgi:hypothetical protein